MWSKIFLLFFVFVIFFKSDHSFDQDLGRHIKLGEIISQTGQVPKTNLFSYTNPDFPFINSHWLFEVLAYWSSQTIGLEALLILKVIIILLAVWLTLKNIPKDRLVLLLPIGFIFLHVLRERTDLRPEIFSFLFTALTLYILEKFTLLQKSSKLIFLLPLIQLIWINTHIYFFLGLILQGIYILHIGYAQLRLHLSGGKLKLLMVVFCLSAITSLINPNGLFGFLYPLNVSKNYGYTIVENQTMFFLENISFRDPNFLFVKISFALIILSLLISLIKRRFDIKNSLLALLGMGLALLNVRSFPYLVFLSMPTVLANFGPLKKTRLFSCLFLVSCFLILTESFFYLNGDYYKYRDDSNSSVFSLVESGKGAMDFVLAKNLPGPIYNNFDIGSYISYRGYPKYRIFVDGRPEAFPAGFFQDIYIPTEYDYNKFKDLDSKYQFKTIIFSYTDQTPWGKNFLQSVVKDTTWNLVYIDDFMLVLVKPEVAQEKKLSIVNLTTLNANSYNFTSYLSYLRLGLFLLGNKDFDSGETFIRKTLQIFPQDPIANSIIGNPSQNPFFW